MKNCKRCGNSTFIKSETEHCIIEHCDKCSKRWIECEHNFIKYLVFTKNGTRRIFEICSICKNKGESNFKLKDFDLSKLPTIDNIERQKSKQIARDFIDYRDLISLNQIWKLGLRKDDYNKYLSSYEWQNLRKQIIKRDNGICQYCGEKGNDVHHLTYERFKKELLSDLILVCRPCHEKIHSND